MTDAADQVVVIGGGVVGAMSAWYLRRAGRRVTLIDAGQFGGGCSHANCGYVCPSHVLPLATPEAIRSTLRAMMSTRSPFSIRPRLSLDLWRWLWQFSRRCNERDMLESATSIHALLQSSARLYRELIREESLDCEWTERGLLFVFHSPHAFQEYAHTDRLLSERFGVSAQPYPGDAVAEFEPALKTGLGGGWHYPGDCHLRPDRLMQGLRERLTAWGVTIREHCAFERFQVGDRQAVAAVAGGEVITAQQFVVATGAWTPLLANQLGCSIPIQPGKGYSLTMTKPTLMPQIPLILEEHRVAVTPFHDHFRLGSTMEFAGYDTSIRPQRLALLRDGARAYLRDPLGEHVVEEWFGWRPMTPDSRPRIDRSPALRNVWVAAGHNMLGLSMGPGTGRLVAELVTSTTPHLDPRPYALNR